MTDYDDLIARLRQDYDMRARFEAADALEAQARRIAHLEEMFHEVRDENVELRARIAELEAALKPYTNGIVLPGAPDEQGVIVSMTVGDLRRARAALEKK